MKIRILVVDRHEMVLSSLQLFLELFDDFEMVGQARDGETALKLCGDLLPDVVITEINLPGLDGVALTQEIRQAYVQVKVIALDVTQDIDEIEAILHAGASCYLFKDVAIDDLAQTVREVVRNNGALPPYAYA